MKTKDRKTDAAPSSEGAAHHPYGPSKWPALLACGCYESRPATEDSERGTRLHQLFARVLQGEKVPEGGDLLEANVIRLATKYRAMHLEDKGDLSKGERALLVERLVWLDVPMGPVSDIYGRVDCAFMDRNHVLHVIDLKTAEHPERDYIPQLIAYASGIVTSIGFDPVVVAFHLAYGDSGREVVARLPADETWSKYEELYERIQDIASGHGSPPRQCGWCALCAKFTTCPAMNAVVQKASPKLADAAKPERWMDLSSKLKAQACALADTLAKWCEAVKDNAAADARAGETIEDPENCIYYGLQDRRGRFVIPDVQAAWEILKPHLTAERYRACLSVNQAALRMELKRAGVKLSEINTLIERCGSRLPDTTAFVRRGLKEPA